MIEPNLHNWLTKPDVLTELQEIDPVVDDHAVPHLCYATWARNVEDPAALALVAEYEDRKISRRDMVEHMQEALNSPGPTAWTRAYMAVQLWGVGTSGRVFHTARTLADPRTPDAFAALARAVADGEESRAAGRWADHWNESFTTKFAYVVARCLDGDRPRTLIYDAVVEGRLRSVGYTFPQVSGLRYKRWRTYAGYNASLLASAEELDVRPDAIEMVLFQRESGER